MLWKMIKNIKIKYKILMVLAVALTAVFLGTLCSSFLPYRAYDDQLYKSGVQTLSLFSDGLEVELNHYNELTQQIRQKSKARKALVAEQKNTSKLNLIKQHDLSRQITTLTEVIEELRSEKENLLLDLGCADDAGVKAVQSEITVMEASLHKLDEQKERYSSELDEPLQQYTRTDGQQTLLALYNFSDQETAIAPELDGQVTMLLNTDWVCFGGNSAKSTTNGVGDKIAPYSGILYQCSEKEITIG